MNATLHCGQTLEFTGNPFRMPWSEVALHRRRGAILVENGHFAAVGEADDLRRSHPDADVADHGDHLLLPGFVDAHVHYPQTRIIASWGKRLIDWLNTYTFPEETRFSDPGHARAVAEDYLSFSLAHGITTAASYCTIHPESADALFSAAQARGMRMLAGRTMMDRNAPDGLRDTARQSHDESADLIARWHGVDRLGYAITPRFAPTSSPAQLEAAGALWAAHPDCLMQTHLSEQHEEIAWVSDLYPQDTDYFAVYERFGLAGPRAVMGHAIHLTVREREAIRATGSGIAHCPTSNTFIGSGLCDVRGLTEAGVPMGLATDVGGGSSFSMLRTMAAAYEVGQLRGDSLHPAELLWLATAGSAEVLGLEDKVGRLVPGGEADMIALDLASTPVIAQRAARAGDVWEALFPTIMLGDDRAIAQVWIAGEAMS
ncbi:MAG: guanine deaminase [Pseudomonadota bacterium]